VLLLLYLALDQSDDRPLIIDQPEENLDPKIDLRCRCKSRRLRAWSATTPASFAEVSDHCGMSEPG
jgi:hypothetical protein